MPSSAATKRQRARRPLRACPTQTSGRRRCPVCAHPQTASTLSSGGASGSRTALSLSSFMLETAGQRSRGRAAEPPEQAAQRGRARTPLGQPRPARAQLSSAAARRPYSSPDASPGSWPRPAPPPPFHRGGARGASYSPGPLAPSPGKAWERARTRTAPRRPTNGTTAPGRRGRGGGAE